MVKDKERLLCYDICDIGVIIAWIKESAITLCKHSANVRPDTSHPTEQNKKVEYISIEHTLQWVCYNTLLSGLVWMNLLPYEPTTQWHGLLRKDRSGE